MRLTHDPEADAIYIYLSTKQYAYGMDIDTNRRIDYSVDGTPIGIELLNVSSGISLVGLPNAEDLGGLLDVSDIGVCLVVDRNRINALIPNTTELIVRCGGRYGGTTNPYTKPLYTNNLETISIELPTPPMGLKKPIVEFRREALTR
jgi:uncharacterized protein YuzE